MRKKSHVKRVGRYLQIPWATSGCCPHGCLVSRLSSFPHLRSLSEYDPARDPPSSRCSLCKATFIMTLGRRQRNVERPLSAECGA